MTEHCFGSNFTKTNVGTPIGFQLEDIQSLITPPKSQS